MTAAKPVLVTAAIIRDGEHVLIARRRPESKIEPGKWEFPGGKVEHGEHPTEALRREIKEELNLEIQIDRFYDLSSHVYRQTSPALHIVLLFYVCRVLRGEAQALAVADFKWIRLAELSMFDFAAADRAVVTRLQIGVEL